MEGFEKIYSNDFEKGACFLKDHQLKQVAIDFREKKFPNQFQLGIIRFF